jgi:hypothetical protein
MRVNSVPKSKRSILLAVLVSAVLCLVFPTVASDEGADEKLTIAQKQSIVRKVAEAVSEHHVDEDTALEMAESIRRALENGDYDDITDLPEFCRRITLDLRKVSNDLHLEVTCPPKRGQYLTQRSGKISGLERGYFYGQADRSRKGDPYASSGGGLPLSDLIWEIPIKNKEELP